MAASVRNNPHASRYELVVDDRIVGRADYRVQDGAVLFPHTEIVPSMRGKGLGATLVQGALDDVRSTGRTVVAQCRYVAAFIDGHPEYADLLAA